jgi:hypothetical protein
VIDAGQYVGSEGHGKFLVRGANDYLV